MTAPWLEEFITRAPILLDGAWGTQLQLQGLRPGECPDAWNLSQPEKVGVVASAYVEAGSDIILSNTFGANRLMLASHGLADQAAEISRAGAEISVQAAAGRARVFASIGPSGKLLMMGEVSEDELKEAFHEQAEALQAGGVDGLVIETMAAVDELQLAVAAAKMTGLPVAACMVFDSGPDEDPRTMMGSTPAEGVAAAEAAGADIIGCNCGRGIDGYLRVCKLLRPLTERPLWIKPNAGLPERVGDEFVYHMTAEEFAEEMPALPEAGATFIGGCCGSTPAFIAALAKRLRR